MGQHQGVVLRNRPGPIDERNGSYLIPDQRSGSHLNPERNVSYLNPQPNGSYLNPAFSQPDAINETDYSMSDIRLETTPDSPISYSELQFENPVPNDTKQVGRNRTSSNTPSVHASGPIHGTGINAIGHVSSV